MILDQLIQRLPEVESDRSACRRGAARVVTGVTTDRLRAGPGVVFVALPDRLRADPHLLEEAVARRAEAVIAPVGFPVPDRTPAVVVRDSARALGVAAAVLHGSPLRDLRIIDVPGSTRAGRAVAGLIHQLLGCLAPPSGFLDRFGCRLGDRHLPGAETAADPFLFQQALAEHRSRGGDLVVLHDSRWAAAAMADGGIRPFLTVHPTSGDRRLEVEQAGMRGAVVRWDAGSGTAPTARVAVRLAGRVAMESLACAAGVGLALGFDPVRIRSVLPRLRAPEGVLEPVDAGQPFAVWVDGATDPDELRAAVSEARAVTRGRLVVVPGEGWNPSDAAAGVFEGVDGVVVSGVDAMPMSSRDGGMAVPAVHESARAAAIWKAIRGARSGDSVLVAGQSAVGRRAVGSVVVPWDDRLVARQALAAIGFPGEDWI